MASQNVPRKKKVLQYLPFSMPELYYPFSISSAMNQSLAKLARYKDRQAERVRWRARRELLYTANTVTTNLAKQLLPGRHNMIFHQGNRTLHEMSGQTLTMTG